MFQNFFEAAKEAYLKALALEPHRVDVLSDLGTAYLRLKRFEEAKVTFEKALHLQPDHVLSQRRLQELSKLFH